MQEPRWTSCFSASDVVHACVVLDGTFYAAHTPTSAGGRCQSRPYPHVHWPDYLCCRSASAWKRVGASGVTTCNVLAYCRVGRSRCACVAVRVADPRFQLPSPRMVRVSGRRSVWLALALRSPRGVLVMRSLPQLTEWHRAPCTVADTRELRWMISEATCLYAPSGVFHAA